MKKHSLLILLFTINFLNLLFSQYVFAQKSTHYSVKNSKNNSQVKSGAQRPFSAYGDFLVSAVDSVDPVTGRITESRTDRTVVINGFSYKAIVSGRREQMPSKLNIPMQGVIVNDTVILDDSPVRIVSAAEYGTFGINPSNLGSNTVVAEIGGQIVLFNNTVELDKFVRDQVQWESQIGPYRVGGSAAENPTSAYTEGAKTVLFMRLDFPDKTGDPAAPNGTGLTEAAAQALMDNSVNPFYISNSYNKTSLTTTVTPVLRMPKPLTDYITSVNSNSGTGLNLILADARVAAQAAGFNPSNFNHEVVATSYSNQLSFAGLGWVGAKGSWLNGYFDLRVTSHELGHIMAPRS